MTNGDTYTHGHQPAVVAQHARRTAEVCAAHLLAHLDCSDRVLDVGCGPGSISLDLADAVSTGTVVAIDSSGEVLEQARLFATERRVTNISFDVGDVYALSFADDEFDVVHAHQVLQHLSRPVDALIEMSRVVCPGGLVAVKDADYGTFVHAPADRRLDAWLAMYHEVAQANGAEPDAGRFLLSWCDEAGLTDVKIAADAWVFADPAEKLNWGESWAERTVSSSLAEQAVGYGICSGGELEQMAEAWLRWANDPSSIYYFVHVSALAVVGPSIA